MTKLSSQHKHISIKIGTTPQHTHIPPEPGPAPQPASSFPIAKSVAGQFSFCYGYSALSQSQLNQEGERKYGPKLDVLSQTKV